ncbi:MAG: SRPBCC domain-containing protein [Planctomycetales bacterium]|nr:SRPBCC domain-containing protein [Planctomycetales bacterium]
MLDAIAIEIEFDVLASRAQVWESLVAETSQWWKREFFATKDPDGIYLEPRPGGRLYEENANGGLLWYTVIEIVPSEVLAMAGNLAPPYGGPATSMLRIEFSDHGAKCHVKLTDHIFGVVDDASRRAIEDGWRTLFIEGLKAHVERLN